MSHSTKHKISASYCILTPMFLGGADHEAGRIRGSAFKGALAFWWRAFHFAGFVEQCGGNLDTALEHMHAREKALFGSSDGGQGLFLLRMRHGYLAGTAKGKKLANADVGVRYLGYGVLEAFDSKKRKVEAGELIRNCINPGQEFTADLLFRPSAEARDIAEITTALKLLGLLGGLGARVRRGFGSIALQKLEGGEQSWQAPASRAGYAEELESMFHGHPGGERSGADWPLSAFASESGIWIGEKKAGSGTGMLDTLGRAFVNYRGWGMNGQFGDQKVKRQFTEDHDWFKCGAGDVDIPYRTAFGLPHIYKVCQVQKEGRREKIKLGVLSENKDKDRRASPMLMHVHEWDGGYGAVVVLMPTKFFDEKVLVRRNKRSKATQSYDLTKHYGKRRASGLDVLQDFLGNGSGKFEPSDILSFEKVLP